MLDRLCILLAAVWFFLSATVQAADLDPIVIKGSHFFYKTNGSEFFIRGIAYQQDITDITAAAGGAFIDALADAASCDRDIPILQQLGINVVHVYAVNSDQPTSSHDECMNLFASAGIYVLVDLPTPDASIDRDDPSWTVDLYDSYTKTIDSMAGYSNLLGFFAGNEISNNVTNSDSAAAVKAAVRDMKAYIKTKNYRSIGVGYATYDDAEIFDDVSAYYNCGVSEDSVDFYGLNIYTWCGDSTYTASGYSDLTAKFENYSVPVFFSEYGCNAILPRNFTEVSAIYGPQMTGTFSGGIAYSYFDDSNDFGVVSIFGNTVSKLAAYTALSTQLASATPSSTAESQYTISNTVTRACPSTGDSWSASPTLPPAPYSDLCSCMYDSLECVASKVFNSSSAGDILATICSSNSSNCDGVRFSPSTGIYDAYSGCNFTQQVSWTMNNFYLSQNSQASGCNFAGNAMIKAASPASPGCQALMAQAKSDGTGTITSSVTTGLSTTSSSTVAPSSSTSTASNGQTTIVPAVGGGISNGSKKSSGGLSTGAKAGIAIGVVVLAIVAAVLAFILWRRHQKEKQVREKGPPESGENGLEVGDAPPQFTALRAAEMEANERGSGGGYQIIKPPAHDLPLMAGGVGLEELSAESGRGATTAHAELPGDAERRERSELSSSASHHHHIPKAAGGFTSLGAAATAISPNAKPQRKPLTTASWSNTPFWSDPGYEQGEAPSHPQPSEPPLSEPAKPPPQIPPISTDHTRDGDGGRREEPKSQSTSPTEHDELLSLEEEERRIDEAIAESERLQKLRREKEELQRRRMEARARKEGGATGAAAGAAGAGGGGGAGAGGG